MKPSTHPIEDKGQVAIDFPDKLYMGSFSRDSKFEARAENAGLFIKLIGAGRERRQVEIHLHHHLLADILSQWAESLQAQPPMDEVHRETLLDALKEVEAVLNNR